MRVQSLDSKKRKSECQILQHVQILIQNQKLQTLWKTLFRVDAQSWHKDKLANDILDESKQGMKKQLVWYRYTLMRLYEPCEFENWFPFKGYKEKHF